MRKFIILLLLAVFPIGFSVQGKKIKRPDSYAFTRGMEAFHDEDYEEAFEWLNKELAEHPDNGYAHFYMGCIRFFNDEYGRACTEMESALKNIPKKDKEWRSLVYSSRARVYTSMQDTVSALKDLEQAIKTDPKNPDFYETRAQIYYEQDNYPLSNADYDQMIALDPGDTMGYMGKGRNAKSQQRWDEALDLFNYVIKLAPDYSSGYSFRAETLAGLERWNEATDDIIKALDIDGDDKAFYLMVTAPEEGYRLLKSKLKIQMAKQPGNRYWPYCIAMLEQENKNYAEAIDYYQQAHKLDANAIFLNNIAECYKELHQYRKALDYTEQALEMSPDDYSALNLKADILSRLGRFDESIVERSKIISQYPESVLSYLSRAENLMDAHRYNEAIEDYNTVTVLVPSLEDSPYLLMRRGDAYRLSGKKDLADRDYNNLLVAEKDSVLNSRSCSPFAYTGLGNYDKAVETMQYIVDNNPDDKDRNLYNLACIFSRAGRKEEAVNILKSAAENGNLDLARVKTDYDFDNLRDLPEFVSLIKILEESDEEEKTVEDPDDASSYEVIEVPFTREGGVTKVQCDINGLPLHFVFDTGAADVTISMVEANFMLKNGYIKPSDIVGSARYIDANGDINEGTVLNIQNVNFGGLQLDNVRASVVRNQKAPILLGQSVLGRLGKIEIDNTDSKLKITHRIQK